MNRTIKAKRNILYAIFNKIIIMILEFVSRAVFIEYLGSELLGVNGVFINIIQCLSLAELGMNNVVMYSYYEPLAKKDKKRLASLNQFYKKIYNIIAIMIGIIGAFLIPFIKIIINTDKEIPHLIIIYFLYLTDTIVSYLFIYKSIILSADQKSYIFFKYEIIINTIRILLQIISLLLFKNYFIYLFIKIIFSIFINIIKAKKTDKLYPYINLPELLNSKDKNQIIKTIKAGFIYKISAILLNSTDNILISVICGTVWVGLLSNYITITTAVSSFVVIIFGNLTASIGNLINETSTEKKQEVFEILELAAGWLGIVCFCSTTLLCSEFINLWIGKEYILDKYTVLMKMLMLFFSCTMQPIFSYREALGLYRKTKYIMLLAAVINILLSIIMGIIWGVAGILAASLISVIITYFWYEPIILYKECFNGNFLIYFLKYIRNVCICICCYSILRYIFNKIYAATWLIWVLKSILLLGICNLLCLAFFYKTQEFKKLIYYIKIKNN